MEGDRQKYGMHKWRTRDRRLWINPGRQAVQSDLKAHCLGQDHLPGRQAQREGVGKETKQYLIARQFLYELI